MDFTFCIDCGNAKQVKPDQIRASSLIRSSAQAIATAKMIPLSVGTSKSILRELYGD